MAMGWFAGCTGDEGARVRKSGELGGSGVPRTIRGWLVDSPNNLLVVGGCCSLSGDVGRVPDLSLPGDKPASPSVLFGADLSERTVRFLSIWMAPLDLTRLIGLDWHIYYANGVSYLRIAVVPAFQAGSSWIGRIPPAHEVTCRFHLAARRAMDSQIRRRANIAPRTFIHIQSHGALA